MVLTITRRLIGRRFDDPTVKKDIESWPFKIIDDNGNPKIEVDYLGERKSFSAQEISSMVLTKVSWLGWLYMANVANNSSDEGDCRDQARQEG